jgi:transcriptional regulator with XRE-family HTH domain
MGRKSKTQSDIERAKLLGKELKRFRTRQDKAQFDIMACMGWRSVSPIIKIEKGRRMPERDTILRWGECLELGDADIYYLLGIAGYVPEIRLPEANHIIHTLNQVDEYLRKEKYPAYVIDNRFAYWMANPSAAMVAGGTDSLKMLAGEFIKTHPESPFITVFDLLFNSAYGIRNLIAPVDQIEFDQIFRFKAYNLYNRHQDHYMSYPDCMQERLSEEDYNHFVELWNAVDEDIDRHGAVYPFGKYGRVKETVQIRADDMSIEFDIVVHPIPHLRNMFGVVLYHPADRPETVPYEQNRQLCEALFGQFSESQESCVKIWEIIDDIESVIEDM